jgi:hypothetical protein
VGGERSVLVLSVAKAGQDASENEDAAASHVGAALRVAIADGATESAFSREWAQSIVRAWVDAGGGIVDSLQAARDAWSAGIPPTASLPWYGQAKLEAGSHATVATLTIASRARRHDWRAEFVGDCEAFVFSSGPPFALRRAIPFGGPEPFGTTPDLASTLPGVPPATWSARGYVRGPAEIWLATDALAHALLREHRRGRSSWTTWREAMSDEGDFADLVDSWRSDGRMRNDDVTVARVLLP